MSLKHGLLGLLNYTSMTGYELNKEFHRTLGSFWQAKPQQIYRELDQMEKQDLLTSKHVVQKDKPNRRVYSITNEGKAQLREWISKPEIYMKTAVQQKSEIMMRMFFGAEADESVTVELLRTYKEDCAEQVSEAEKVKKTLGMAVGAYPVEDVKYWALTVLYSIIMSKARCEWAEKAIEIVENAESLKQILL